MKLRAVCCAGLCAAAAGGCNDLIGLEVGQEDPIDADAGSSASGSSVSGSAAGGSAAGGSSAGGSSAVSAVSAVSSGAGGGDPACNEAEGAALVEPSGLWGDTVGASVDGIAALDDGVMALVNETASLSATSSFTVARWSASGARKSDLLAPASGVRGTHLAVTPGVTFVAGESTASVRLSGAQCHIGPQGGVSHRPSFVAALDSAGQCTWAWSVDFDGGTTPRGLAATSGAVVLAIESAGKGRSYGPCVIRRTVAEGASLIAALDPESGACKWDLNLGDPAAVSVRALVASATAGSLTVVGSYNAANGAVTVGEDPSRTTEGHGLFVARYALDDGAPQQVTTLRAEGDQRVEPRGVAQLPDGDLVVVGNYAGPLELGDACPRMPDAGNTDNVFVARVSEYGAVWSRGFGDASTAQRASGVTVDGAGSIHVTGLFSGELDLGSALKLAAPAGKQAGFLMKLDAAGHLVSASKLEGDTADLQVGVAAGAAGGPLVIAGNVTGTLDLDLGDPLGGDADAGPRGFVSRLADAP
ncbi:hypothetical protein [Sorangium sp. So ce1182]|uniref:hypothetical protein n=1 Tax=Sorangium sp. So ce1182 TaxID=3133334 RepID=UPI003F5D635C